MLIFAFFSGSMAGSNLQQLEQAIKASNGINSQNVGPMISAYLQAAFQCQNFPFQIANFTLAPSHLYINSLTIVWGIPFLVSFTFTNSTGLDLNLKFQANISSFGGLQGIVNKVAPSQWNSRYFSRLF